MNDLTRNIVLWVVIAIVLLAVFSNFGKPQGAPDQIQYSQFLAEVRTGGIETATFKGDTIVGERAGGQPYVTFNPETDNSVLIGLLDKQKVKFSAAPPEKQNFLLQLFVSSFPILLLIGVWIYFMRQMQGGAGGRGAMSFGKSRARLLSEDQVSVTFADVAGVDEAKEEVAEIVDFLKDPSKFQKLGGKIPKGVLLVGAPGTGKTLLAKALAGEAGVPFFSLSGSDFVEMFVGIGAARVRDLFAQAQAKAPSIIFIDELDALGKARGVSPVIGGHDEREQTLNQLLAEVDGFDSQVGVMILAATNRPEVLDPALLRPGRFDRQLVIDRPDLKGRRKILGVHTRHVVLAPSLDLGVVAARTAGFVGADLANLVNEAALRAAREGKVWVELEDFDEAIDRVVAGLERKSRVISAREKEIVAHHEAGHALVARCRQHADPVSKVSIIPRGLAALGYTQQQPIEDRYLMTRAQLLDRLDVLLGGRVAEEIIFVDVSTGAHDDLQKATDLARHMITQYGMSAGLGLATYEAPRSAVFLGGDSRGDKEYSEATAREIDTEVRELLEAAHARVRETLTTKRDVLEALAKLLMEREVVTRESLDELLEQHEPEEALRRAATASPYEEEPCTPYRSSANT